MDIDRIPVAARDEWWEVRDGKVWLHHVRVNTLWDERTRLASQDLEGLGFWQRLHPDDRKRLEEEVREGVIPLAFRIKDRDGQWVWAWARIHLRREGDQQYRVLGLYEFGAVRDGNADLLRFSPGRDILTGLLDRASFINVLQKKIDEQPQFLPVIVLDIHRFHEINASYGVNRGDEVLQATGQRLRDILGEEVPIGRLGPDEFGTIPNIRTFPRLLEVIDRIDRSFNDPLVCAENMHIFVSAHIGVAVYPIDGQDPYDLVRRAELALSSIKPMRERGVAFYSVKMEKDLLADATLRSFLVEAVEREELEIFYQPIFSLKTRRWTGMEALLRWYHPHLGNVPPSRFIPIAEKLGLMGKITEFVLRRSAQDLRALDYDTLWVSVNVSPSQFHCQRIVEHFDRVLDETGLEPGRLVMEVTESTAMRDPMVTQDIFQTLKSMGIRIALDDFGTGYSSMSHLITFNLDKIKLDRAFVMNLPDHERALHVARTIVQLTHSVGAQAVAEGIETEDQLVLLQSWSCDEGQGFFLTHPMSFADIQRFIRHDL